MQVFQELVVRSEMRERSRREACLRQSAMLETLSDEQIAQLADASHPEGFNRLGSSPKAGEGALRSQPGEVERVETSPESMARRLSPKDSRDMSRLAAGRNLLSHLGFEALCDPGRHLREESQLSN